MLVPFVLLALQTADPVVPARRDADGIVVNEILCENPRYAMDFAAEVSKGDGSEMAKDVVGKAARRDVCGRFIGLAVSERTLIATNDGIVYRLVAFRFKKDNRLGWLAESSFAPGRLEEQVPL